MGYRDEGERTERKQRVVDRGEERRRERKRRSRCDGRAPENFETRNNRPITWVTAGDRSREPGTEVYAMGSQCDESGENRFTKPGAPPTWTSDHSSFSSSSWSRSSSLSFLLLPLLPRRRHDRMNWTGTTRLPFSFLRFHLRCHAGSTSPCNEHLPRSGGREITRSFIPYLHSCQLMSHRVQRCAATFSVSLLSSACSLPSSYTILRLPGRIDRWHELSR